VSLPALRRSGSLFGREAELAVVAAGAGSLVFVEGHAGIGKTSLLGAARARAGADGVRVLWGCGQELERGFGFGVVRQLFERVVSAASRDERGRLLAGPAALASVAVGVERAAGRGGPAPDSPFPVVHALYWLTANLAERERLELFVDDAHWADGLSLRFLDYLAARLEGLSVAVVVAARPAEPGERESAGLLAGLRGRARSGPVRLGPLGFDAAGALVSERFGDVPDRGLVAACVRATGGNPFLLGELVDALRADGVAPDAGAAGLVAGLGPETVARSVMLRLGRLPAVTGPVVDAVAVLDAHAEVRHVAALCGLSLEEVGSAADALARANVLDGGRPLRFVHPIVRQAVYGALGWGCRSRLHARAAEVLMADQAAPERVAAHLLLCEPGADPRVGRVLRAAAAVALSRGSADLAQRFLGRALAEPPPAGQLADTVGELGAAEALAGRELGLASEHLERSAAGTADPQLRCERVRQAARARLYMGDFAGAAALLGRGRASLGEAERSLAMRLLADEAGIAVLAPPVACGALERLEEHAGLGGDDAAELALVAELAAKRWLEGRIGEAAALAERALGDGRLLAAQGPVSVAFNHALAVLIDGDRFERTSGPLAAAMAAAREQGSLLGVAGLTGLQAVAAWRRGALSEVEVLSREILQLAEDSGTWFFDHTYWAYLGAVLTERSELEQAEQAIARSGVGPGIPNLTYEGMPFVARARLRLAQGRPDEALADLLELRSRERALGVRHMRLPWRRDAVEAALALGDSALAAELADEQLELARRWNIPSARGIALCTQGLATGGADGLKLLEEGVAFLSASPARLDHTRALVDLGAALRRAGARSREPLQEAIQTAQACGASALAARAHQELLASGARPRRLQFSGTDALTAGERRVATLAAQGQSNRQIAVARYITVRTVENHLASCYRKLGISSRHDLPSALAADRPRAPARRAGAPAPAPAPTPASRRTPAPAPHPR
jgi:DNA-binding NarL/FixJ family response regulator